MSPRTPSAVARQRPDETGACTWDDLPVSILERLASESVRSPADWLALSRARRASIFGITQIMRRTIDAAAKASAAQSEV
jgi:hypothetical protein